jgi:hypothetical protein
MKATKCNQEQDSKQEVQMTFVGALLTKIKEKEEYAILYNSKKYRV